MPKKSVLLCKKKQAIFNVCSQIFCLHWGGLYFLLSHFLYNANARQAMRGMG
jgi:hypothetical protein